MTIKEFKGYITPDGLTHKTRAEAQQHMKDKKINEALAVFAQATPATHPGVEDVDGTHHAVFVEDLPKFLFENRAQILAALTVADKAARKPRADKGKPRTPRKPVTVNVGGDIGSIGTH